VDDPERRLVRRFLARRDEDSFRALYRRHTPSLYLLAVRFLGGRAEADDAVQEAWVRACSALDGFRWQSSLRTWLGGIVVNCCRELVRKRLVVDADVAADDAPAPARPDDAGDLEELIRRLPRGCREVFVLYCLEGNTHEEVAARLAIAPGTSKHQLFRARRTLRAWLSDGGSHDR